MSQCYFYCLYSTIFFVCFFFFSSRRRHTRSLRDWSSDVCSSDLDWATEKKSFEIWLTQHLEKIGLDPLLIEYGLNNDNFILLLRSEERRVGKSVDLGGRGIMKK